MPSKAANALGAVGSARIIVAGGATVQVQGGLTMANVTGLILNGAGVTNAAGNGVGALESITGANSWGAVPITLVGPATINTDVGQLTLTGAITGAADLTKLGGGMLILSGANTYSGQTNVGTTAAIGNGGILQITTATALGAITGGTVVNNGSTLQINAAITVVGEKLTLNGAGLGLSVSGLLASTGALLVTAGNTTWTGEINLATNSVITNTATLIVSGALTGSGGLTKLGTGQLTSQANNTYTGSTTVTVGTLDLQEAGSLLNTTAITVNINSGGTGAILQLDNTAGLGGSTYGTNYADDGVNAFGRLGNSAQITLNGGNLTYLGTSAPGMLSTENLENVRLVSGNSTITSQTGAIIVGFTAPAVQLNIISLTRFTGATVNFVAGGAIGTNQPLGATNTINVGTISLNGGSAVAAASALVNGIFPWATVQTLGLSPLDFATYFTAASNGLLGLTALPLASYATTLAGAGPTSNVRLTANQTLTGNLTVNSLIIVGTGGNVALTEQLSGPPASDFTLNVASGAIMATGGNTATIQGGTVNFGTAEGVIFNNNSNITINSAISGTSGVTITSANNTATLGSTNTYTSSSVQTLAFGGTVSGATPSFQLSFNNGVTTATTGSISWSANAPTLVANIQAALDTLSTIGAANTLVTGSSTSLITIAFRNALANSAQNPITVAGNALGGATITPTEVTTGSSIATVFNGPSTLSVGALSALGNGAVRLMGGTFSSTPAAIANPITFADNSVVTLNTATVYTGPITLGATAGAMVSIDPTATSTIFAGAVGGPGTLSLFTGGGTLVLNGANTYSGGTNIGLAAAGTVVATNSSVLSGPNIVSGSLGSGAVNLTSGTIAGSASNASAAQSGVAAVTLANAINLVNASNAPVGALAATIAGQFGTTLTFSGNVTVTGNTNNITESHTGVPIVGSVQTLTFGAATSATGTFTLSYNGTAVGTTFNLTTSTTATAASIQTALNTLLGTGNTLVAAPTATTITVTFLSALANSAQPLFSVPSNSLTTTLAVASTMGGQSNGLVLPGVFFNGQISGTGALTFLGAGLTQLGGREQSHGRRHRDRRHPGGRRQQRYWAPAW